MNKIKIQDLTPKMNKFKIRNLTPRFGEYFDVSYATVSRAVKSYEGEL